MHPLLFSAALTLGALSAPLSAMSASLTLTGTVRDFNADGVNFEGNGSGVSTGLVAPTLSGPSPTLTAAGAAIIEPTNFAQWFTKTSDSAPYSIVLNETAPGSGLYQYTNNDFFPIDGQLLGNQGNSHNYHFTYNIAARFDYQPGAGQIFTFLGDDDVWVFFDKKLGIDLGGVHGAASASVNLDTLLTGYSAGNYSLDFFFAERHLTASNLQITTSLLLTPAVPEPDSLALVLAGLVVLGRRVNQRRRLAATATTPNPAKASAMLVGSGTGEVSSKN